MSDDHNCGRGLLDEVVRHARVAGDGSRGPPSRVHVRPGAVPPSALPLPPIRHPAPPLLSPPGITMPVPDAAGGIDGGVAGKAAEELHRTRGMIADSDAARLLSSNTHAKERVSSMATDGNGKGGDGNYTSSPVPRQENKKEDEVVDDYEFVEERRGPITSFPAGFHFQPTDEDLILTYLRREINKLELPFQVFHHVDFSKHHPEELVEKYGDYGEDKWFFFTSRESKHPNGSRPNRTTKHGYWKATGSEKPITVKRSINGHEQEIRIGSKKSLVFYLGSSGSGVKTNWIMHEYENYNEESKSQAKINELVVVTLERKKGSPVQERRGEGVSPSRSPPPVSFKRRRLSDDDEVTNQGAMAQVPGESLQRGHGQVAVISAGELQGWSTRAPFSQPAAIEMDRQQPGMFVRPLQSYRPSSDPLQFPQLIPRPSSGSSQFSRSSPHPSLGSLHFPHPSSSSSLQFPPRPSFGSLHFPQPSPHPSSGAPQLPQSSPHPSLDSLHFPQPSPHPSFGSLQFPHSSPFPQASPHPSSGLSQQFCPSGHGALLHFFCSAFEQGGVYRTSDKAPYNHHQATSSNFDQQGCPPGGFWP